MILVDLFDRGDEDTECDDKEGSENEPDECCEYFHDWGGLGGGARGGAIFSVANLTWFADFWLVEYDGALVIF